MGDGTGQMRECRGGSNLDRLDSEEAGSKFVYLRKFLLKLFMITAGFVSHPLKAHVVAVHGL